MTVYIFLHRMAQLFARLDEVKNSGCVVGNDGEQNKYFSYQLIIVNNLKVTFVLVGV